MKNQVVSTVATAYGLDLIEAEVDDLEDVAYVSAAFYDGYLEDMKTSRESKRFELNTNT